MSELSITYNHALVVLSVVIAIVSAFVALAAVPRIHDGTAGSQRTTLWALVFGLSLGAGIWAMHFIAMLALNLPVPVRYNGWVTLISLLVGIAFSTLGILPVRRGGELGGIRLLGMGTLMGLGIAGMHYSGMAAMQMAASMSYDYLWVAVSVIIAVTASSAALWIANHLRRSEVLGEIRVKLAAATVMGLAVSAMHYSGMAAVHFFALPVQSGSFSGLDTHLMTMALTIIVGLVQGGVLVMAALDQSAMADRRLARNEENQRRLLDMLPDGVLVHGQGVIVYANPAACRMAGLPVGALTGRNMMDFVHVDSHPMILERMQQVMHSHGSVGMAEEQLLRADGSVFTAEVEAMPTMWDDRRVIQVVIHDVSDREQKEEEISRLATILERTSDFVGTADVDGHVLYVNKAGLNMVGLAADTPVDGRMISDFHSVEESNRLRTQIFPIAEQQGSCQVECTFLHQDGHEVPASAVFTAHKDANGDVTHYSVIARDLSVERKRMQQLEHTQRLESLGILAGGIAHDFNNILTAIMGNAAMAGRQMDDQSPAKELLSRIELSTQHAADLCRQMLAYSGKGKFVVKAINLSGLVEEMTRLMEVSIEKNVVIKYHLSENLPAVEADVAQIQQVILNLITNANEAIAGKSGVISFSSGVMHADRAYLNSTISAGDLSEGRYVFVEVSDTGCGMDAETIKKMFDPFFTTKFTGRGLGMSAVLGIVRGHHGALRVYSEPGNGTTFKILLPVSDQKFTGDSACDIDNSAHEAQGLVLVVDDEETVREVATMMLEDIGFSVLTAENGLQALDVYRLHQHEIAGVLMDMTMPKMDGKTCFRELRRINADVKVILSSGYNEQDATSRFAGKGLAGFIQKPYSPEALKAAVLEIWGKRKPMAEG